MASTTIAFNTASTSGANGGLAIGYPATLQSTLIANNLAAGAPSRMSLANAASWRATRR